jgi:hypothetical protein
MRDPNQRVLARKNLIGLWQYGAAAIAIRSLSNGSAFSSRMIASM